MKLRYKARVFLFRKGLNHARTLNDHSWDLSVISLNSMLPAFFLLYIRDSEGPFQSDVGLFLFLLYKVTFRNVLVVILHLYHIVLVVVLLLEVSLPVEEVSKPRVYLVCRFDSDWKKRVKVQ